MTGKAARRKPAGAFATSSRGLGAVLLCAAALCAGVRARPGGGGPRGLGAPYAHRRRRRDGTRRVSLAGGARRSAGSRGRAILRRLGDRSPVGADRRALRGRRCAGRPAGAGRRPRPRRRRAPIDVTEIRLHENYTTEDGPPENDIALLRLAEAGRRAGGAPARCGVVRRSRRAGGDGDRGRLGTAAPAALRRRRARGRAPLQPARRRRRAFRRRPHRRPRGPCGRADIAPDGGRAAAGRRGRLPRRLLRRRNRQPCAVRRLAGRRQGFVPGRQRRAAGLERRRLVGTAGRRELGRGLRETRQIRRPTPAPAPMRRG